MDNRIKELFERYQSGSASTEERKLVEDWFDSFENGQHEEISSEKKAMLFEQMDTEINHLLRDRKPWATSHWLQAAAVVLICSCAALFTTFKILHKPGVSLTYTLISAPKGVKKQCALADGTIVYLNSGSTMSIPSNYGTIREILLTGEAFFIVKHDPSRPFKIRAGKLAVADIGTSFNVKAYNDEGRISVAVESGIVSVEENNLRQKANVFAGAMTHNQELIYDKKSRGHILNNIQTSEISAWKENKLKFDNASIDEIALTLERWYNVTIKLDNNTGHFRRYTVSFNNEPVSKVLDILGNLSGLTYKINNKSISINLKPVKKS
ncbi:MAG TPA: FecR domain-containing protein [Mucilaginibacter sp.]|nr:FecR domain-containing protein [Mucilaginibacter sp.]